MQRTKWGTDRKMSPQCSAFLIDVSLSPQTKQQAFPAWDSHQTPHAGDPRHYWRPAKLHLHLQSFWSCSPKSSCFPHRRPPLQNQPGTRWEVCAGSFRSWLVRKDSDPSWFFHCQPAWKIFKTQRKKMPNRKLDWKETTWPTGWVVLGFFLETEICTNLRRLCSSTYIFFFSLNWPH